MTDYRSAPTLALERLRGDGMNDGGLAYRCMVAVAISLHVLRGAFYDVQALPAWAELPLDLVGMGIWLGAVVFVWRAMRDHPRQSSIA